MELLLSYTNPLILILRNFILILRWFHLNGFVRDCINITATTLWVTAALHWAIHLISTIEIPQKKSFYWNEPHVLFLHVATLMYCYQHHYWQVCDEDHEQCVVCETVPLIYCYQHHWDACCWSWPVSHVKQSHVDGCCWYIWPARRMWNSHTDVLQSASLRCLLLIMTSVACETATLRYFYQHHWGVCCWSWPVLHVKQSHWWAAISLWPVCCMWNTHIAVLSSASLRCLLSTVASASHVKQSHWCTAISLWPVCCVWNSHIAVLSSASLRCRLLAVASASHVKQSHWFTAISLWPVCCKWNSHIAVLLSASLRCLLLIVASASHMKLEITLQLVCFPAHRAAMRGHSCHVLAGHVAPHGIGPVEVLATYFTPCVGLGWPRCHGRRPGLQQRSREWTLHWWYCWQEGVWLSGSKEMWHCS